MESMVRRWFAPKRYGWGWTPVTWQGWLTVAAFVTLLAALPFYARSQASTPGDALLTAVSGGVILLLAMFWICFRTGGRPRWRWGGDREKEE